jgi:hypothetical protein
VCSKKFADDYSLGIIGIIEIIIAEKNQNINYEETSKKS